MLYINLPIPKNCYLQLYFTRTITFWSSTNPVWNSQPNSEDSPKCLLTYLKQNQVGGGSAGDFLMPVHRIDQAYSSVL